MSEIEAIPLSEIIEHTLKNGLSYSQYTDVPDYEIIGTDFLSSNSRGIFLTENHLGTRDAQTLLDEALLHHEPGTTLVLAVEGETGTKFFYSSSAEEGASLKALLGSESALSANDFFVENMPTMKNILMGLESAPVSTTMTATKEPGLAPDSSHTNSLVPDAGTAIAMAIAAVLVITFVIFAEIDTKKRTKAMESKEASQKHEKTKQEIWGALDSELSEIKDHLLFQSRLRPRNCYKLLVETNEEFKKLWELAKKDSPEQKQAIAIEYAPILDSLNRVVSEEYYGDIVAHPNHYRAPVARLDEVEDLVRKTNKKIFKDIVEIKRGRANNFEVDIRLIEAKTDEEDFLLTLIEETKVPVSAKNAARIAKEI